MYVRGKGVEYGRIASVIDAVSFVDYGHNIRVHPDAGPIGQNGYGFRGRIIGQETDGPGTRHSASGRRGRWACWHAYRDVLREIFAQYPDAVVTTAMARYEGAAGFESTYPATADVNVGSHFSPAYMSELCACDDNE